MTLASIIAGCGNSKEQKANVYKNLNELNNKKIGVQSGCGYDKLLDQKNIKAEMHFFTEASDVYIAAKTGKLDAFIAEDVCVPLIMKEYPGLKVIPGILETKSAVMAFGMNSSREKYLAQMNEFINDCNKDGTLESLKEYWLRNFDEEKCELAEVDFPKDSKTISIAFESTFPPFGFYKDNRPTGYDIDVLNRFCLKYGYKPQYIPLSYDSILPGLEIGKFDMGANLYVTDERKDSSIAFSDPYAEINVVVAYILSDSSVEKGLLESLQNSFYRNFIKDNRWKMFFNGLGITVSIVLSSIVLGTLLGFILYLICRYSAGFRKFTGFVTIILKSVPTVLFLMIFYYVIFSNSTALSVSILCFSILFGISMYNMLDAGVKAVGENQLEAAIAQGFNDSSAFFYIILPQAALHFLPAYRDEVINLIKETAVVGYIAVMDITKTSDIIRGITFEAFFPLISSTILYFIIIAILVYAIKCFNRSVIPEKRSKSKILSGINANISEA